MVIFRYAFFSFHFIIRADCPFIIVFDQVMDVLFRDRNNEEKKDEHKRLGTTTSFIKKKTKSYKERISVFTIKYLLFL